MESVRTDLRAKWRAFKTRIQATWFWRVFGVCAMKKLWTKFLVAVAIAGGWLSALFGLDLLNHPIPPLMEMSRTEGVLVHVYQPLSSAHGSKIRIRTKNGVEITYRGSMFDNEKESLLGANGMRVVVWSMPYFEAWPPFYYESFWQVEWEGEVLLTEERTRAFRERNKPNTIYWFKFSLALVFFPLFIVMLTCRKEGSAK